MNQSRLRHFLSLFPSVLVLLTLLSCGGELTDFEHVQRAKDLEDTGDIKGSIIELKNALQKNPENTEARWLLGDIYVNVGLGEHAEKELRRSIEYGLGEEVVVVSLIRSLLLQKKYKEILGDFEPKKYQDDGTRSDVYALRAEVFLAQGNLEKAYNEIEKALQLNPDGLFARLEHARYLIFKRQYEESHEILDALTRGAPDFVHGWKLLGDLESVQNNLVAAEAAYSKAVENSYQNSTARIRRAFLRLVLQDYAGAEKDIRLLKKIAPQHYKVLLAQGVLDLQKGEIDKAISSLHDSRKHKPNHIPTLYYLGVANYMKGNLQQAENTVSHVIFQRPGYVDARRLLAQVRLAAKDYPGVIDVLQPLFSNNPDDENILLMLGYAEIARGNKKIGIAHMKRVAELNPDSSLSRVQYGLALLEGGDTSKGLAELEEALNLQPGNKELQAVLIGSMLKTGKYEEVLERTKAISDAGDKSALTYNSMGVAYLSKGNKAGARKAFTEALDIDPAYPDAAHNLALLEIQDGNIDKARQLYKRILAKEDAHLDTLINLAKLELSAGNFSESQALLETATKKHPGSIDALIKNARLSLRFGRPAQAISMLKNVSSTNQNNPELLAVLGEAQLEINQARNAVSTLEKLIPISPGVSMHRYLLAKGYIELGKFEQAEVELNKALGISPKHLLANITLSRLHMSQGNPKAAKQILNRLETLYPEKPEVLGLKGWLALQQDKPEEAIKAYQDALKYFESTRWMVSLANAYGQTGARDKGLALLASWVKKYPEDFVARFTLAGTYLELGQNDLAKKEFELLIKTQPDNLVLLNNLSWLLRKQSPAKAVKYAERAYSINPKSIDVRDTLALALLAQGHTERALRLLQGIAGEVPDNLTIQFHLAQAHADIGNKHKAKAILETIIAQPAKFEERGLAEAMLKSLSE